MTRSNMSNFELEKEVLIDSNKSCKPLSLSESDCDCNDCSDCQCGDAGDGSGGGDWGGR